MKKKTLFLIIVVVLVFGVISPKVNAKSYYYNDNGVYLTQQEYQYISELYWEGYQQYLAKSDYNLMKEMDIFNHEIKKSEIMVPLTIGNTVTSHLRTLSINSSCSSECMITLVMAWMGTPTVKSYDVMGARVDNATITRIINTVVTGNNYGKTYTNFQRFNNGFGISVLVPNVDNIKTATTFLTTNSGTIYGSYQHAKKNITEAISKNYSIGPGGYGNVFNFIGNATGIYDDAPGVSVDLS